MGEQARYVALNFDFVGKIGHANATLGGKPLTQMYPKNAFYPDMQHQHSFSLSFMVLRFAGNYTYTLAWSSPFSEISIFFRLLHNKLLLQQKVCRVIAYVKGVIAFV